MKRAFAFLCIAVLLLGIIPVAGGEEAGLRGYVKGSGYVYVSIGTYPTEKDGTRAPVIWRVLSCDDKEAFILSEYILDVHQVIECDNKRDAEEKHNFRRISDYKESDLYTWMNGEMFTDITSEQDFSAAVIEKENGMMSILALDEILNLDYGFSNDRWNVQKTHMAKATPYALARKLYPDWGSRLYCEKDMVTWWIIEIKNPEDIKMGIVGYNGHLSFGVYTRVNIGVRPALTLDLSAVSILSGSGTLSDPYVLDIAVQP